MISANKKSDKEKFDSKSEYQPFSLVRALQDIRRLQRTVDLQIPKLPFFRVIKEIMQKLKQDYRIQSLAVDALRVGFHLFLMEYQW